MDIHVKLEIDNFCLVFVLINHRQFFLWLKLTSSCLVGLDDLVRPVLAALPRAGLILLLDICCQLVVAGGQQLVYAAEGAAAGDEVEVDALEGVGVGQVRVDQGGVIVAPKNQALR